MCMYARPLYEETETAASPSEVAPDTVWGEHHHSAEKGFYLANTFQLRVVVVVIVFIKIVRLAFHIFAITTGFRLENFRYSGQRLILKLDGEQRIVQQALQDRPGQNAERRGIQYK